MPSLNPTSSKLSQRVPLILHLPSPIPQHTMPWLQHLYLTLIYLDLLSLILDCAPRRQAPGLILAWLPHNATQGLGSAGHIVAKSDLLSVPMAILLAGSLVRHCLKVLLLTEESHLPTLDLHPNGSKCERVEACIPWRLQ